MTTEEKAKAYDEALAKAKEMIDNNCSSETTKAVCQELFHELAESEDERIRKSIIHILQVGGYMSPEEKGKALAYLEKQRYDRMQPVYDNQESFESALDKAWKSYNDSGARTVDSCEDDYIECAHAKGFREGYLFGLQKQKEPENVSASTMIPSCWEVEQKEQKPINNSTREKIISRATSEKQVVLLSESNGNAEIGWDTRSLEDAKKLLVYGITFINEQLGTKPAEWSGEFEENIRELLYNKLKWDSEDGRISTAVFIDDKTLKDIVTGIWFYVGKEAMKNPNMELPKQEWGEEDERNIRNLESILYYDKKLPEETRVELGDFLKSLRPQPKDNKCTSPEEGDIVVNKYGEISVFENWGHHPDGGSFNDKTYFFAKCTLDGDCYDDYDCHPDSEGLRYATPEEIRKIVPYLLKSLSLQSQKLEDWTEEDKEMLNTIVKYHFDLGEISPKHNKWAVFLKSLHPSWKPSEEEMRTLNIVISDYRHACTKDSDKKAKILKSLLEQLEKL